MNTNTQKQSINITDINAGDVFSEESHYVYLERNGDKFKFRHLESNQVVYLDEKYVSNLLITADQYNEEVEVGLEDKSWTQKQIDDAKKKGTLEATSIIREGDLKLKGIRSIWTDIHSGKVFSVCFTKQSKELNKKTLTSAKDKQLLDALANFSSGKVTLEEAFRSIQNNPILPIEKGDERILRGFKVQFSSANGFYDVIDMDIIDSEGKGINLRKVNINEILWLVIDGVKYVVA